MTLRDRFARILGRRDDIPFVINPIDEGLAFIEHVQALHRASSASVRPIRTLRLTNREAERQHIDEWVRGVREKYPAHVVGEHDPKSLTASLYRTLHDPRMSQLEDPVWFMQMSEICSDIQRVLPRLGLSCPEPPLFGSLDTGRINGLAMLGPRLAVPVIFVETGFFGFANLFAKIVAQCLPVERAADGHYQYATDQRAVLTHIESKVDVLAPLLEDVLIATVIYGHPHRAQQYDIDDRYFQLANIIRDAMEYFIIAHEYGHFIAGHLTRRVQRRAIGPTIHGDAAVELVPQNWEDEFEADAIGQAITVQALYDKHEMHPSIINSGIELVFDAIGLIQEAQSILLYGRAIQPKSLTHPPFAERIRSIRAGYYKFVRSTPPEVDPTDFSHQSLQALWRHAQRRFVELHQTATRPTKEWSA
jgi:hypothetical protein